MKLLFSFFLILASFKINAQNPTKRVLFIGNSYTGVNNLPLMVANVANSMGDTIIFDSNTPGGYRFINHITNSLTLTKIQQGNWDYVVLQEQSQAPSFPPSQVELTVFPFARALDSVINTHNPCAETVFYMTWGRKNGDANNCANWPPVCTYAGMDSLLNLRYRMMADSNEAILSPVGAVWKYIRTNFPNIELYDPDQSHPSVRGTYAAACCFYTTLFRKDPTNITFNAGLPNTDANNIKQAVKEVVYNNLADWHIGAYDVNADFTHNISSLQTVNFLNSSQNATNFLWFFGDGDTSSIENPVHNYTVPGNYTVTLIAFKCGLSDTLSQVVNVLPQNVKSIKDESKFSIYPNPALNLLSIKLRDNGKFTYKIHNLKGQVVRVGELYDFENFINIESLSSGTYILELMDGKILVGQERFVKE